MVFIYSNPKLKHHTSLNTPTENAVSAEDPPAHAHNHFLSFSSSETVIIDCYFFFSSVRWSFKADSSVFVYMNQSVNRSCSLLCRLLITLLNLEVPLSRWEILKWCIRETVCACVCICALMCKYRKQSIRFVQKISRFHRLEVEFPPRYEHKLTHPVVALCSRRRVSGIGMNIWWCMPV